MQVVAALLLLLVVVALVTRRVSAASRAQQTPTGATNFTHITPAAIAATQHRDLVYLKARPRPPREGLSCPPYPYSHPADLAF